MDRPNVLWIMADQLRRQALGCYGDPNARTPNIDALAADGILCEQAISNCPVCMPFRGNLMTGQLCHHSGVYIHGDMLTPDRKTIAHSFQNAGYRTSYVGKWHLASSVSDQGSGGEHWVHPLMRGGFEDWYGFDVSNHYYNTAYSHGEMADAYKIEKHQTDGLADLSLQYLMGTAFRLKQPWFHVISFEAPHGGKGNGQQKYPYNPASPEYEAHYSPQNIILRPNYDKSNEKYIRERACGYYAMIEQLDANVGRLIKCLKENGQYDNTLIVFLADHGEMLGSHGCFEKCIALEESIGIPLIFKMPKEIGTKGRYNTIIGGTDIYPTCAGLCNIEINDKVDGEDISCNLRSLRETDRVALVQWFGQSRYHWGDFPYRALRTARYSYCEGKYSQGGDGFDEIARRHTNFLYDMQADPYQMNNLFDDVLYSSLKEEMRGKLRKELEYYEDIPDFIN